MPREPQSYGSQQDWTTGETGQNVNDPKASPPPQHEEFYSDRREDEGNAPYQGGRTSPVQLAENDQALGESQQPAGNLTGDDAPVTRITGKETGAKRDSFFKKRDYGE